MGRTSESQYIPTTTATYYHTPPPHPYTIPHYYSYVYVAS